MNRIEVKTEFSKDMITQELIGHSTDIHDVMMRQVIRLQDQGVRDALIKLGWTPPDAQPERQVGNVDMSQYELSEDGIHYRPKKKKLEQETVQWGVEWGKAGEIPCVSIIKRLAGGGIEVVAVEYGPQREPGDGLTDRERSLIRFALYRFSCDAQSKMNEAAQDNGRHYDSSAVEKFARDAADAQALYGKLQTARDTKEQTC